MDGFYKPLLFIKGKLLIFLLSFICDACVPIYCFCAGYAAYLKSSGGFKPQKIFKCIKSILDYCHFNLYNRIDF